MNKVQGGCTSLRCYTLLKPSEWGTYDKVISGAYEVASGLIMTHNVYNLLDIKLLRRIYLHT